MMGDFGTGLLIAFGVLVAVGLVLAVVAFVVIRRYELPVRGVAATLGSLVYLLSPVDAVPEIPLGPIGLIDDLVVVISAVMYVRGLVNARTTAPGPLRGKPPGRVGLGGRRGHGG